MFENGEMKMNMNSISIRDKKKFQKDDGFTLVELLVVLVIIGLLATLATPQVLRYLGQAKVDTTNAQISNFESALELYFIDNGKYPEDEEGLMALISKPASSVRWNGPYIKIKGGILDPWGNPYLYKKESSNYQVISYGSDGALGGEGVSADITN